ncbi:MAG TPA: chromosome partitioning protein ParB [Acidimicrobiia bacterium]
MFEQEPMSPGDLVPAKKLTNWKREPSLVDLKKDLEESRQSHQTSVSRIDGWLDNLHVRNAAKIKVAKNASAVQPKLIRKQAEWRYAALSEPFLSTPSIFKVNPVSWEDVKAAQQNQIVLNNQFNTRINKVAFIDEYVRTAVDEGTVIVKLGWDFREEEFIETVPDVKFFVNPEFGPIIEQVDALKRENPAEYDALPDMLKEAHELSIEQGEPVEPEVVGEKQVTSKRTVKNDPTLEICDYRNIIVDPTCKGDFTKASFIAHKFESSLSALKKDGKYTNLDQINLETNTPLSDPDFNDGDDESKNFSFADEARKKLVVYEYWGFRDLDGSGVVKPFVAAWVGDTLIRMDENPFPDKGLPFVKAQYLPVRKETYGEPDGELLIDNQKIVGAVTRGMIDLMGKSANAQQGVRKDALDPVNRRKFENGQDYEFNPQIADPRHAIFMHQYPEIPQSAMLMVQQQNQEAESITGVKAFSGGLSGDALGTSSTTATATRGVLDAASKRELGILRRLSQGMLEIARKIIAMNQEFLSEEEVVRITNEEFVTVRRDDLAGHFDLRLSISTAEEDNAKAQELAFMLQTIGPDEDPFIRKSILADIMRLRKMPDLAKKIEEYEPEPDPMQQQIQMLTLEKLKKEIAKLDSEAQENFAGAQLDMAKAGTEGAKVQNLQSDSDLKNLNFVEQESGVTQERALQQTGEQARSQAKLKLLDHQFNKEGRADEALQKYVERLQKFQAA